VVIITFNKVLSVSNAFVFRLDLSPLALYRLFRNNKDQLNQEDQLEKHPILQKIFKYFLIQLFHHHLKGLISSPSSEIVEKLLFPRLSSLNKGKLKRIRSSHHFSPHWGGRNKNFTPIKGWRAVPGRVTFQLQPFWAFTFLKARRSHLFYTFLVLTFNSEGEGLRDSQKIYFLLFTSDSYWIVL